MNHPLFKKLRNTNNSSKEETKEETSDDFIYIYDDSTESPVSNDTVSESSKDTCDSTIPQAKVLTFEENLLMQLALEKQKSSSLMIDKLSIVLQTKKLVIQNFEMRIKQINDEMNIISEDIKSNQTVLTDLKFKYAKLVDDLTIKYGLDPKWTFNQETGEIIQ